MPLLPSPRALTIDVPLNDEERAELVRELRAELLEGKRSLGALLGLGPDDLRELMELGQAYLRAGRFVEARRVFAGLCALEPDVSAFRHMLGMSCEAASDFLGARAAYDAVVRQLTDAASDASALFTAYLSRAVLNTRTGDREGALRDLAHAADYARGQPAELVRSLATLARQCGEHPT